MEPLERAIAELQEQNYGSAIRTLEMLTARDPSNAEAQKHLSQAYYRTNQREKAAEAAQRYVALRPTDPAGHYNAGVILAQLGQTPAAERAFRAALSADPSYVKAREALEKMATSAAAATEATVPPPTAQPTVVPSFSQPTVAVAATPAAPAAPSAERKRGPMPLPAKVAAGGTVVASIAILLWLFLPGGPANPGRPKTAPRPSPSGITTPPPNSPTAEQPNETGAPQPPTAATTPAPEGKPAAPPESAPAGPSTAGGGLALSPEQAQQLVDAMDRAHQASVGRWVAGLGKFGQFLRTLERQYGVEEARKIWADQFVPVLATLVAPMLATQGTPGQLKFFANISGCKSPSEAADLVDRVAASLPVVLPSALRLEMLQVLTTPGITPQQTYDAIDAAFRKSGVDLLDGPRNLLRDYLKLAPLPSSEGEQALGALEGLPQAGTLGNLGGAVGSPDE